MKKKKRKKKILLTKKPHVFGLSIFNIYCNKQIISKEKKKHDQHWLGYLFPSVQLTFDSDYWCGIVVSSNKHDDLIFIYAFLLKSHLFLLLFIFQSFRIIAKQSFSMQKCTLKHDCLASDESRPACSWSTLVPCKTRWQHTRLVGRDLTQIYPLPTLFLTQTMFHPLSDLWTSVTKLPV